MDKKIGYIIIEFLEKQKLDVINWSKNIGEENLYSVLQKGKIEDGYNIFVIYGAGHAVMQEPVIRSLAS